MNTTPLGSSGGGLTGKPVPDWFIYGLGSLGAILWGYDTGVISGALLYIKVDFGISVGEAGLITAAITIGAAVGSMVSALLVDRLGRKNLMLIAAVIFVLGTLAAATARDATQLILGRAVLGVGIGFIAVNVPIYLSEIAPARLRGGIVSLTQFMSAAGILIAYLGNLALSPSGAWRVMIGVAVIPAALLFIGALFLPESPRWLVARGRITEALASLAARDRGVDAALTVREIQDGLAASTGAWRSLRQPWARRPLLIAVLMTSLAQLTGISIATVYAPTVLTSIGLSQSAALITTVGFGSIAVLGTIWAVRFSDSFPRRRLLIVGGIVTSLAMLITAVFTWSFGLTSTITGVVAIVAFAFFKAAFSSTWGPISRVVETEILPMSIRGSAVSIAEVGNFAALFIVTLLFPLLLQAGAGFAFFVFAVLGAVAVAVTVLLVPETRGKTLEEIEIGMRSGSLRTVRSPLRG